MKDVAVFKKVSRKQFKETIETLYPCFSFTEKSIDQMYENIQIPKRATAGSVGYDIVTPFAFTLRPGNKMWIPTGLRVEILKEDWCLIIVPKSRTAKSSTRMSNTLGVVDQDYYYADNEGHMVITLEMPVSATSHELSSTFGELTTNFTENLEFKAGDGIGQGLFIECGMVMGEDTSNMKKRTGGFGSTGN